MTADEQAARSEVSKHPDVSRETMVVLDALVDAVRRWQKTTNLIANSTLGAIWRRHILDSLQLAALKPDKQNWVDIGSGGGFPGLVIAALLKTRGGHIALVESNSKKSAFLRAFAAAHNLPCQVHDGRIETVLPKLTVPEVVTARALASLTDLLALSNCLLKKGAIGLFPKGQSAEDELTEAARSWQFHHQLHPSLTNPAATIIEVRMDPL